MSLTRTLTLFRYGLTVQNASFVNFDREGMVAVGGFAKARPAIPLYTSPLPVPLPLPLTLTLTLNPTKARPAIPLYTFENCGGMETRFSGTTWLQSNKRVHWRWIDEAVLTDLDGTFTVTLTLT